MTGRRVPLGVLDLVPVSSGSTAGAALRNTIDLAQKAEALGYSRYWFAEHHLNPGVAGSSPALLISLAAGATDRIRLGSGGVQSGHRTPLSTVEEFGILDALHPGRLDLGIGRSGGRNFVSDRYASVSAPDPSAPPSGGTPDGAVITKGGRLVKGLLIPERPNLVGRGRSPRLTLTADLLQQAAAETADYRDFVGQVLALLDGSYRSADGLDPRPVPGQGAQVQPWVLGSSAGRSAQTAGAFGLPFAANYHVSPATVLEATEGYRAAFVPSARFERPYVAVSADVVVAPDDDTAQDLARGFALWVRSIRRGEGAMAFPSPEEAARHVWTDEDRALIADRVDTQFVGSPATVVAGLEHLVEATGADEVIVTTITHDHADRVRSYQLLAEAWF